MLNIIILLLGSVIAYYFIQKIGKVIKAEKQILYLILGVVLGTILKKSTGKTISEFIPQIGNYNTFSILFMFFVSGFTINLAQLKRSGSLTAKLFTVPVYVETLISTMVIYLFAYLIFPVELKLILIEAILVAVIFASSSPANMIPPCSNLIKRGYTGENNLPGTMITVSVMDGFVTVPLIFSTVFILLQMQEGMQINFIAVLEICLAGMLVILISVATGVGMGWIIVKTTHRLFKRFSKEKQTIWQKYMMIIFVFVFACLFIWIPYSFPYLKKAISLFGILIMCGIGFAIGHFDQSEVSPMIRNKGNNLFAVFGMPMIFIYVGASIHLKVLLNLRLLLGFVCITVIAIAVKGLTAILILKNGKYTKGEKKFAAICFIPKGVGLINFSVIFASVLQAESNLVTFMIMLATVSIILSMSVGIPLINKAAGKLIMKNKK